MAEEEKINTDIDDWLNDLEDEDSGAEELEQADIDNLLGTDAEAPTEEEAGGEELSGELDQADIDSLLGDGAAEENDAPEGEEGTIDQEEMDRLFGSSSDQEGTPGDAVDFAEILGDQEDPSPFDDLDGDAFSLEAEEAADKTVRHPAEASASTEQPPAEFDEKPAAVAETAFAKEVIRSKPLAGRLLQVVLGMLLILLLGGGGAYYYFGMRGAKKAVVGSETEKPVVTQPNVVTQMLQKNAPPVVPKQKVAVQMPQKKAPPVVQPDHKPVAMGNLFQMPAKGGEVAIQLRAEDQDGNPLTYEVVDPPSFGRLSGKAPSLVYLPNADFPGRDSFTYRASDGKETSEKAKMYIVGPNLAAAQKPQKANEQVARRKKEPTKVFARDEALSTTSSKSLIVDWLTFWKQAHNAAADSNSGVEVQAGKLQGTLSRLDEWHYRYQPPKFFQGREIISYRFKRGKKYSVNRLLTIKVSLGDNKPEIVVAPMTSEYLPGQTVTIDARDSRDEKRAKLRFVWQQLSGVPVKLVFENHEGSVVSFVMPSSFAVDTKNGITLQLTAIDAGGKRSSHDILIHEISRNLPPLWTQVACD